MAKVGKCISEIVASKKLSPESTGTPVTRLVSHRMNCFDCERRKVAGRLLTQVGVVNCSRWQPERALSCQNWHVDT